MAGAARPRGWERRPSASCWGSRPEMAGDMAPVRPLVPNQRRSVRRGPTLRLRPCGNGAAPGWELWPWPRCAPCGPAGGAHRGPAGTMGPAWTIASASRRAGQKPTPAAGSVGGRKYHRHAGLAAAGVGARARRPPPSMGPPRRRPLQLVRRPSSAASSPKIRCCPCDPACLHPPDACTREVQFLENCQSGCTRHRWPCPEHHCRPRYLKSGHENLEKDVERRFSYAFKHRRHGDPIFGGP